MAYIILPSKWTKQPQYPVEIDWNNQLSDNLLAAYSPNDINTVFGSPTKTVGEFGVADTFLRTSSQHITIPLRKSVSLTAKGATLIGIFNSTNIGAAQAACALTDGTSHFSLLLRGDLVNDPISVASWSGSTFRQWTTTAYTSGTTYVVAITSDVSGNYSVYVNGILQAGTLTNGGALPTANLTKLEIGSSAGSGDYLTGSVFNALAFEGVLSVPEINSISENPWQVFKRRSRRIWVGGLAGGDVTLPIGFVTETDSANSITSAKSRAIGQVSESDSAIGIGASKSVTLGLNVETNQAQAIARAKSAGLGITTETDTSFALLRSKLATIGQPIEADSANAVARSKTVTLGIVVEADSAPSLGAGVSVAIGQVVESDSVPPIAATKTLALGLVTEIDTPIALAQASGITLGLVTESDTAPAISVTKVKVLGQVTEANTVAGIANAKSATIGQVIEADNANPLVGNLVAVLGLVTEVEFAHSISLLKSRGLLQVTEADSVFGLTKDKVVYISQVVEVDQVFSVFSKIDYRFVESSYNTLSIAPCYNKMYIDPNYH